MADFESMDNFEVRVVARTRAAFDAAVTLAMRGNHRVVAWTMYGDWYVFLWHADAGAPNVYALPCALEATDAATVAWAAVNEHAPSDKKPDIDGHVTVGFELEAGQLGYTAFRVRPVWAHHHK